MQKCYVVLALAAALPASGGVVYHRQFNDYGTSFNGMTFAKTVLHGGRARHDLERAEFQPGHGDHRSGRCA